jgi:hypothetical protein
MTRILGSVVTEEVTTASGYNVCEVRMRGTGKEVLGRLST